MALRRRSLYRLIAGLLIAVLGCAPVWATSYLPGTEDIPLMDGLVADPDATVVFDAPTGRIVAVAARAESATESQIRQFYARALPSLGWRAQSDQSFVRESERLQITISRDGKGHIVRFDIRPR